MDAAAEVIERVRRWLADAAAGEWVVATSGSTGRPKRVRLSREAVLASVAATSTRLGYAGGWALALPPDYVAGLMVIARSLAAGVEPLVVDAGRPALAAPLAGRALSLVPTQLHRLLADPAGAAWLATGSLILLGGGPVDPALRARAEEAGLRVVASYGASETCGGCVYDGLPLPGVDVALEADGRITISGPVLFSGYQDDPGLTAETLVAGRYRTGDLGEVAADGRLRVLGRLDEVIVSGGVNVPGGAVATRLREHPGVAAAEVVGVPDPEWGERVVAYLVSGGVDQPTLAGLRDWVAAVHPRAWAPRHVVWLEEMPLLGSGKTDRQALTARGGQ